jgi:uncharacterized protein (DUF488 family)
MSTLYTIGYEGTDIDRFVATLKSVGVAVVADVRAIALSRKKGFSKTALRTRLNSEGIDYLHFVALGDPKPGREAARAGKYAEFHRIYEKHLQTAASKSALKELELAAKASSVCLLCFEKEAETCHRTNVAKRLKSRGLDVANLIGDDPNRYAQRAPAIPRRHASKGDAKSQPEVR